MTLKTKSADTSHTLSSVIITLPSPRIIKGPSNQITLLRLKNGTIDSITIGDLLLKKKSKANINPSWMQAVTTSSVEMRKFSEDTIPSGGRTIFYPPQADWKGVPYRKPGFFKIRKYMLGRLITAWLPKDLFPKNEQIKLLGYR